MKTLREESFDCVNQIDTIQLSIEATNKHYHFTMKVNHDVYFHEKCKTSKQLLEIIEKYRTSFYDQHFTNLSNIAKCLNDL